MRLFVYGTLKKGFRIHNAILKDAVAIGEGVVNGVGLWNYNDIFPIAAKIDGEQTIGELYDVDLQTFRILDKVEDKFRREQIDVKTPFGTLSAYIYLKDVPTGLPRVVENDWQVK